MTLLGQSAWTKIDNQQKISQYISLGGHASHILGVFHFPIFTFFMDLFYLLANFIQIWLKTCVPGAQSVVKGTKLIPTLGVDLGA